ncbi:hypothetical protein PMAYCL1PPCAC_16647, partial [Pristionchus mayeri]
ETAMRFSPRRPPYSVVTIELDILLILEIVLYISLSVLLIFVILRWFRCLVRRHRASKNGLHHSKK